jgi:hypothetical protein
VSVEAKENWDELVKKFLLKFFHISKVQDLRGKCSLSSKERMKELMKLGTVLMNYLSEARTWDFPVT